MRTLNRIHSPVHQVRIFQNEIFWPTLQSIYDVKLDLRRLDDDEAEILRVLLDRRSLVDIDQTLLRQRELAVQKEEKQAELERKWNLIHTGCNFIALLLNEDIDEKAEPLTPHEVYRTLAIGEPMADRTFEVKFS